jgi:hypothetical protein
MKKLLFQLYILIAAILVYNAIGFDQNFEPTKDEERPRTFLDSVVYAILTHTMLGDASTIARTTPAKVATVLHVIAAWISFVVLHVSS